jgi:hypothetical protein
MGVLDEFDSGEKEAIQEYCRRLLKQGVPALSTDDATVNNELSVGKLISTFDTDHFIEMVERSIADTERQKISDQQSNLSGGALINDNTNDQTCLVIMKASGSTIIVEQTGSGFSTVKDNQGTVNLYNEGSTHQVENETGAEVQLNIMSFGVGF